MNYLLDTNVISEQRNLRPNSGVAAWLESTRSVNLYISVLTVGEIQYGADSLRRRNAVQASDLDEWLRSLVQMFGERVLPVDLAIAQRWGQINVPDQLPRIDGLIAATALEHGLTVVTRNVRDFERAGAQVLNPFS